MIIKFSCDKIQDISKIYKKLDSDSSEAGYSYQGTNYCTLLLSDVIKSIATLTSFFYKGIKDRNANEEFVVQGNTLYNITFRIDTFDRHTKAHFEVTIESVDHGTSYNTELESLKRLLKNRLLKDWQVCTWLQDDQSEALCTELYSNIFHLENDLRAFVSKVMIFHFGITWLQRFGMEKYLQSVETMETEFKQRVPDFENINTQFLSMTLETLKEILFQGLIYKEPIYLNPKEYELLCTIIQRRKHEDAKKYLSERRIVDKNLWKDIFAKYFDSPEKFESAFLNFIKNRNHVAHNKIVSLHVYKTIQKDFLELRTFLDEALANFDSENASSELKESWMETIEEVDFSEYKRNYLRDKIEEELGITIFSQDTIYDKFCDTIYELYNNFYDRYHYDEQFKVTEYIVPDSYKRTIVFSVISNACPDSVINIRVKIDINDEIDADSSMKVTCEKDTEVLFRANIIHHNGSGYEDEDGVLVAGSETSYDDTELDEMKEELINYIDEKLNPYIAELEALEYISGTEGGPSPVAYFSGENCGQFGVSVRESFFPLGKCCFCGFQNVIKVCHKCGEIYDVYDGNDFFCNGCLMEMDKE